jgi:transposase
MRAPSTIAAQTEHEVAQNKGAELSKGRFSFEGSGTYLYYSIITWFTDPWNCRWSILPALSHDGMIYLSVREGAYNSDMFLEFIASLLTQMQPFPAPKSVVVLDNCKIHKDPRILEHIVNSYILSVALFTYILTHSFHRGMHYEFLPPYLPDYNPIELSFNVIKARLRRDCNDFRQADDLRDDVQIIAFLHWKVFEVSANHAREWFRWSGY